MLKTSKTLMTCFAAALVCVACKDKPPPATVTTTGAQGVLANDDAIRRLSDARCQRQLECDEIGQGKDYKDVAACTQKEGHDLEKDLHATECPRGIREDKLAECAAQIRNTKCGTSLKSVMKGIGHTVSSPCHTGAMCLE